MREKFCVVYVTAPPGAASKKIAASLVKDRLAACVSIVPAVTSHYRWKGKIESARESLLIIKTKTRLVAKLTAAVEKIHPYDVPEIISLPIHSGSRSYLKWLSTETKK